MWSRVYSYFGERLTAIGCTEWEVPTDDGNIPSSLIDKAFTQRVLLISSEGMNNQSIETTISHEVKIFYKGFRDPRSAEKEALDKAQGAVSACINGLTSGGPHGVLFSDLRLEPFDQAENDNIIVAILNFNVRMFLCID